jgi:hypothetical protein
MKQEHNITGEKITPTLMTNRFEGMRKGFMGNEFFEMNVITVVKEGVPFKFVKIERMLPLEIGQLDFGAALDYLSWVSSIIEKARQFEEK